MMVSKNMIFSQDSDYSRKLFCVVIPYACERVANAARPKSTVGSRCTTMVAIYWRSAGNNNILSVLKPS